LEAVAVVVGSGRCIMAEAVETYQFIDLLVIGTTVFHIAVWLN
jgi:hypothetical protein